MDANLLGIYLNDHLAGATAGVDRSRHLARSCRGTEFGPAVEEVATEIAQDRRSLAHLMRQLDVPARRYKVSVGWAAEKLGRLKANGRLVHRSPLSTVIELEMLRVGVAGKLACWQTLRRLCDSEERLDAHLLDDLLRRAQRQLQTLEELHLRQVTTTFRTPDRATSGASR
ncbi:hypothetical protein JIX56_42050 [Streptomyces sp. CA-210063]|nr:hypothetical protein [Streptomyces sp. CA-210063]UUU37348.1 hypothetical protein JIX56_42050 [Streptomyces sp. CA-210063]